MSAGSSTSHAQQAAALRDLVQAHYADADRISVTLSATGEGRHLRWHYSEDLIGKQALDKRPDPQREPSPALSYALSHLVDDDGDSVMGDDEERPRTPPRLGEYDPGSVVLTPKKDGWRTLRCEGRIGGGVDWWHDEDGVEERLTFIRDNSVPPGLPQLGQETIERKRLGPDALRLLELLEDERARHGWPRKRSYSKTASPIVDDDARSVISDSSEATVIIDPRQSPEPTLLKGEMPIIRQPTLPADYEWNGPGAVQHHADDRARANVDIRNHRLSTIQEESASNSSSGQVWPPRVPEQFHVRIYRDDGGNWVREGSFGPDAAYHIHRDLMPPHVATTEVDAPPAGPSSRAGASSAAGMLRRTDTEVVVEIPMRTRRVQQAQPVTNLRRSARLRK